MLLKWLTDTNFELAYTILKIDHSCGAHEGSLPNSWSTKVDYKIYKNKISSELRKNFDAIPYHLHKWENVAFPSRDKKVTISGW